MNVVYFILLLLSLICFVVAAFFRTRQPATVSADLVALGLAFWVAVPFLEHLRALD